LWQNLKVAETVNIGKKTHLQKILGNVIEIHQPTMVFPHPLLMIIAANSLNIISNFFNKSVDFYFHRMSVLF